MLSQIFIIFSEKINFILLFSHFDAEAGPHHKLRGDHKGAEQHYQKCFGLSPEFHGKDHPCVFPFIYRGIVSDPEFDLSLLQAWNCIFIFVKWNTEIKTNSFSSTGKRFWTKFFDCRT